MPPAAKRRRGGAASGAKPKQRPPKPPPPPPCDSSDAPLSDDDFDFVQSHGRAALSFLADVGYAPKPGTLGKPHAAAGVGKGKQGGDGRPATDATSTRSSDSSDNDDERDYERAPRQRLGAGGDDDDTKQPPACLPVKTLKGEIVAWNGGDDVDAAAVAAAARVPGVIVVDDGGGDDATASPSSSWGGASPVVSEDGYDIESDGQEEAAGGSDAPAAAAPATPAQSQRRTPPTLLPPSDLAAAADRIATLAAAALASPDDPAPSLRPLVEGTSHPDPRVARLALLSSAAVLADVVPGYRVRAPGDDEDAADEAASLSKEVRALRARESALLKTYQAFLRAAVATADAGASVRREDDAPLAVARRAAGRAAVRALGEVVARAPHFNHAGDVVRALVTRLASADARVAEAAASGLSTLFAAGSRCDGASGGVRGGGAAARLTRDGAQLIADLIKTRKCRCAATVLAPLSAIDLTPPTLGAGGGGVGGTQQPRRVGRKATARAAKAARNALRRDPVAAARAAASVRPDDVEAALVAGQTADAVFEAHFRPLKHALTSGALTPTAPGHPLTSASVATSWPLLTPALAGLAASVAGLSVEYASDLHACLSTLLSSRRAPPSLHAAALSVAAAALTGVGDALASVDRGGIVGGLFSALADAPVAFAADRGVGGPASSMRLLDAAGALLADVGGRTLDAAGTSAMARRLAGTALLCGWSDGVHPAIDEPIALGALALLDTLVRRSRVLRAAARRGARGARGVADDDDAHAAAGVEDDSDDGGGGVRYGAVAAAATGAKAGDWGAARAAAAASPRAPLWELGELASTPTVPASVRAAAAALVAQPEDGGAGPRCGYLTAGGGAPASVARAAAARLRDAKRKQGGGVPPPPSPAALGAARDAVHGWFVAARDASGGGGRSGASDGRVAAAAKVKGVVAAVAKL